MVLKIRKLLWKKQITSPARIAGTARGEQIISVRVNVTIRKKNSMKVSFDIKYRIGQQIKGPDREYTIVGFEYLHCRGIRYLLFHIVDGKNVWEYMYEFEIEILLKTEIKEKNCACGLRWQHTGKHAPKIYGKNNSNRKPE